MSFREKTHWVAFIVIAVAFGWYFLTYPWHLVGGPAGVGAVVGMLTMTSILIILAMSILIGLIAARSPRDAHLKEDERERTIHWRGTHYAYYPLVIGVYGNLFAVFYQASPAIMLNLLLATVVVCELIRVGAQLYFYRRGY